MPSATVELREKYAAARNHMARGENEEAARMLERIVDQHPGWDEAYPLLCEAYLRLGRGEIPGAWLTKALDQDSGFGGKVIENTTRMYGEGRLEESAEVLDKLVECDGGNHEAWNDLGVVRFALQEFGDSERAFMQAIELCAGYGEAILNLTALYMTTNRAGEAVRMAAAACRDDCEATPDLLRELAVLIETASLGESNRLRLKADRLEVLEEVGKIKWFHTIDLGGGVQTPGRQHSPTKLPAYGVPDDLTGKSVLDIGAWDGFNSFEAERRGARRVLATDYYCWGGPGWGTQDGFNLARKVLGSRVEDMEIDVMDLCPERVGTFDLVFYLGVLYHMRYPMEALERVFSVTGDMMILETHVDMLQVERPVAAFYPGNECGGDPTNWWGPNTAAVIGMLEAVGYSRVEEHSLVKTPVRIVKGDVEEEIHQGRLVVHAWR